MSDYGRHYLNTGVSKELWSLVDTVVKIEGFSDRPEFVRTAIRFYIHNIHKDNARIAAEYYEAERKLEGKTGGV